MEGKFSLGLRVCSGHYNKQVWAPPEKGGVLKYLIKHPTTLMEMRNTIINHFSLNGKLAESARAFTGRRNSHSGRGEDFLSRQQIFFTETALTPERKVEKLFPMWEINRHAEG